MREEQHVAVIAQNIKKYLTKNEMLQKELARRVGVAPSTMTDYLKLRSRPSHEVVQRIADVFGVPKTEIDTTYKEEKFHDLEAFIDEATTFGAWVLEEEDRKAIKASLCAYFEQKAQKK